MAGGDGVILPQRTADTVVNIAHSRKFNVLNGSFLEFEGWISPTGPRKSQPDDRLRRNPPDPFGELYA